VDEADSVEDMQALARKQWFKRARELGMVSAEALEAPADAEGDASDETILERDIALEDDSKVAAEVSRHSSSDSQADE
jgi:hypothetical protein